MKNHNVLFFIALTTVFVSCSPWEAIPPLEPTDLESPVFLGAASGPDGLELRFDEAVRTAGPAPVTDPPLSLNGVHAEETTLFLEFGDPPDPGIRYLADLTVTDGRGNALSLIVPFWGHNPDLPDLVINEVGPQGSGSHPDAVELLVRGDGDLAGLALYIGTRDSPEGRYVFPSRPVEAGVIVIVHCRPEGQAEERDETGDDPSASGGLLSHPTAWDFWLEEPCGIPGSNGAVTIYDSPTEPLRDAVIWTVRPSDPEDRYRGWTSASVRWADDIGAAGAWHFSVAALMPGDAVDARAVTSTRTLCRDSGGTDSDGAEDWHTVPTRGSSFGEPNSDEVHVAP